MVTNNKVALDTLIPSKRIERAIYETIILIYHRKQSLFIKS